MDERMQTQSGLETSHGPGWPQPDPTRSCRSPGFSASLRRRVAEVVRRWPCGGDREAVAVRRRPCGSDRTVRDAGCNGGETGCNGHDTAANSAPYALSLAATWRPHRNCFDVLNRLWWAPSMGSSRRAVASASRASTRRRFSPGSPHPKRTFGAKQEHGRSAMYCQHVATQCHQARYNTPPIHPRASQPYSSTPPSHPPPSAASPNAHLGGIPELVRGALRRFVPRADDRATAALPQPLLCRALPQPLLCRALRVRQAPRFRARPPA